MRGIGLLYNEAFVPKAPGISEYLEISLQSMGI
jgi:hypothetical protein